MRWLPKIRLRFGSKLFLTHLIAVFLVSGSVGTYFYFQAMDGLMHSLRSRLQNSAALLSHSLDARDLETIRQPADMALEVYQTNLDRLRRMRRSNPDIAFLYVMRKAGERLEFVLDSDETDRQAPPGREYTEATSSLQAGFHGAAVDEELARDEWGVFLSGYAPLLHGEGRYLVGIDMRAEEVDNKLAHLRLTGLVSLFASLLLALLFALSLSRGLGRRLATLTAHCRRIAAGRFEERLTSHSLDELDDLADAFNIMSEDLAASRRQTEQALAEVREARDGLEIRVQERTHELQKAVDKVHVLRGLLPICCACKKVRDDKGYWQQVEQFVEERTDARFTHGLCPTCSAKFCEAIVSE